MYLKMKMTVDEFRIVKDKMGELHDSGKLDNLKNYNEIYGFTHLRKTLGHNCSYLNSIIKIIPLNEDLCTLINKLINE